MVPMGEGQWIWMVIWSLGINLWNFDSIQVLSHVYRSHLLSWLSLLLAGIRSLHSYLTTMSVATDYTLLTDNVRGRYSSHFKECLVVFCMYKMLTGIYQ